MVRFRRSFRGRSCAVVPGVPRPSRRLARWSAPIVALAVLGAFTSACAPPPAPVWINVQWARDAGGTTDTSTGAYSPSWGRYLTKSGTTTGPTPAVFPLLETPPPFLLGALVGIYGPDLPDGTARFPWNGFAGEGISVTAVTPPGTYLHYSATFPGGSCTIFSGGPGASMTGATPSPDGKLIAVSTSNNDNPFGFESAIDILSLTPGSCPRVTGVSYHKTSNYGQGPDTGDAIGSPAITWAPNSGAILYTLDQQPDLSASIVRLDATAGSAPSFVLGPAEGCTVPLGWSVENRILLDCLHSTGSGIDRSRIESIQLGGGLTNVIDSFTSGAGTPASSTAGQFGYYAPGTSTIVFNKAVPVVNSAGIVEPWFQVHTTYDLPFGQSTPLSGSPPPFGWHQEAVPQVGIPTPPFTFIDVPNPEFVERWVR